MSEPTALPYNGLATGPATYLPARPITRGLKRAIDFLVASLGLVLTAPLFLLIAVLIKLDSPGPVFFRQVRVGLQRRRFSMWKFRKMPQRMAEHGPSLTRRHDHRLTTVGRWLERTKLDELPQLLNVLRGDMSIVGPRPELPRFVDEGPGPWDVILSVKPGIFGPTQLLYRNESELYPVGCTDVEGFYVRHILPHKLGLDAGYARRGSIVYDLALLAGCALAVFSGTCTWQTLVIRRWQIINFIILSILGIGGMVVANRIAGASLPRDFVLASILLASVAKPACLLAFQISKALATSMTADDFLRIWSCGVTSAALIVAGILFIDRSDVGCSVLLLDTSLFVTLLLTYKLLLYAIYVHFYRRVSNDLSHRLVYASLVLAPLSLSTVVTLRHGTGIWEGASLGSYLPLLLLTAIIRPVVVLLRPVGTRPTIARWWLRESRNLVLGTLVGSSTLACTSLVLTDYRVDRGDLLGDAAVYLAGTACVVCWQHHRLNSQRQQRMGPADPDTPAAERIVLVGSGIGLSCYIAALTELPEHVCELVGLLTPQPCHRTSMVGGYPIIGHLEDIPELLKRHDISRVVVVKSALDAASLADLERWGQEEEGRIIFVEMWAPLLPGHSAVRCPTS